MTRPWVQQLHQSGATVGQVVTWDGTTWVAQTPSPVVITREVVTAPTAGAVIYLDATPLENSEAIYVDGLLLAAGVDYTLSGSIVTLTTPLTGGEVVIITYFTSGAGGTPVLTPRPAGFTRPAAVTRPVRRFHRIR
jgi:hypothetical protein